MEELPKREVVKPFENDEEVNPELSPPVRSWDDLHTVDLGGNCKGQIACSGHVLSETTSVSRLWNQHGVPCEDSIQGHKWKPRFEPCGPSA